VVYNQGFIEWHWNSTQYVSFMLNSSGTKIIHHPQVHHHHPYSSFGENCLFTNTRNTNVTYVNFVACHDDSYISKILTWLTAKEVIN